MASAWIVFGGWAVGPRILSTLFGPDALFIDSNSIIPRLMRGNELDPDWRKLLAGCAPPEIADAAVRIAGWSTGAILAAAFAESVRPSCAVFIAATPSFCRGQGFPFGWKPSVLHAMRGQLAEDREWVLDKFYMQCGLGDGGRSLADETGGYETDCLAAGLAFLERASLLPLSPLPFPSLFLHGESDTITPPDAGKYFCKETGGVYREFKGPHAFFITQCEHVRETIDSFAAKART